MYLYTSVYVFCIYTQTFIPKHMCKEVFIFKELLSAGNCSHTKPEKADTVFSH